MRNIRASISDKLDTSLIFGIFTTLAVAWIYILQLILELGLKDPLHMMLFPLSFLHYALFILTISSLLLLYGLGLSYLKVDFHRLVKLNRILNANQSFLLKFWAPLLLVSITNIVTIHMFTIKDSSNKITLTCLFVNVIIISGSYFFLFGNDGKKVFKMNFTLFFLIVVGYVFYLFTMVYAVSDVEIKADKELYTSQDEPIISIQRKGYIFLPYVKSVVFTGDTIYKINAHSTFKLNLKKYPNAFNWEASFIEVTYMPQIFEYEAKAYSYPRIAQ